MRIISGRAGGIRLQAPDGTAIRPTEDRVKEALFASLGNLQDLRVLDLYSGCGSLGLEALSRGAAEVLMVEINPEHVGYIEKNLSAVLKSMQGNCGKSRVLLSDVRQVSERLPEFAGQLDLILADPPYNPPPGSFGGRELLLDQMFARWCGNKTLFVLEHETGSQLPWYPLSSWKLERQKHFGKRTLSWSRQVAKVDP